MGLIDEELQKPHVKEERKLRFGEFTKEQSNAKNKVKLACLKSHGHRDFYEKAKFVPGFHDGLLIFAEADNPKVLIFANKSAAEEYAKDIQGLLRSNGFGGGKAWAEQVALRTVKAHPYSSIIPPEVTYERDERYIICIKAK